MDKLVNDFIFLVLIVDNVVTALMMIATERAETMKTIIIGKMTVKQIERGKSDYDVFAENGSRIGMIARNRWKGWDVFGFPRDNVRKVLGSTCSSLNETAWRFFRLQA